MSQYIMFIQPIKQCLRHGTLVILSLLLCTSQVHPDEDPRGHLKPLGSHQPPEGTIDSVEGYLNPDVFYKNHIHASKPVLFKGAAHTLPAFKLWNDDYLRETYGQLTVLAERGKKENRDSETLDVPLIEFLDLYKNEDIYMVQDIHEEMKNEVLIPESIKCGGYTNVLQMGVLWFSSGGTKSVLHIDESDNINCLLDGEKDLIFIDRRETHKLRENEFDIDRGFSKEDVEKVDMHKFPVFQNLKYWKASMEKGDCLYIPVEWAHHVNSSGPRNFAVNLWFGHLRNFDQEDCDRYGDKEPRKVSEFFMSDKHNFFLMEDYIAMTPYQAFSEFADIKIIKYEDMEKTYSKRAEEKEIKRVFQLIDTDNDGLITWDEIEDCPVNELIESYPFMKPPLPEDLLEENPDLNDGQDQDFYFEPEFNYQPPKSKDEL